MLPQAQLTTFQMPPEPFTNTLRLNSFDPGDNNGVSALSAATERWERECAIVSERCGCVSTLRGCAV